MFESEQHAAAERLQAAAADGQLSLEDFSERIGAAYAATNSAELARVVADLPAPAQAVAPAVHRAPFGPVKRGGRWRLDTDTELEVKVGTVKLDLRGLDLARPEVTLGVRTLVGTIKVWLPPELRVVVEGRSVIGGRQVEENHLPPDAAVPTLRLRLDTVIGTVKVYKS